jgi:hypothetical protein
MTFLLVMVAAAAVIVVVSAPFRRVRADGADRPEAETAALKPKVADLEVAREAKYREIRDAELDHRTGKLSDEDFRLVDDALRAEAISILQALDRAKSQ